MEKAVLITGATAGMGRETALLLHSKGLTVFASGRNKEKLTELENMGLKIIELDITSESSQDKALENISNQGYYVHTLINNAGYGQFGAIEEVDSATAQKQFDTNVFGLVQLTRKVIPGMREHNSGRIVNMSSIAGKISMPVGGWYAASKFALEALSDAMRWELKPFGIKVVIIEPGPIKSDFGKTANSEVSRFEKNPHYAHFYEFVHNFDKQFNIGGTSEFGAKIIAKASTVKHPRIRYRVTAAAKLMYFMRVVCCDRIFDAGMMKYFKGK